MNDTVKKPVVGVAPAPVDSNFDQELSHATAHSLPSRARLVIIAPFLFLISLYQRLVSPALQAMGGANCGCRFYPTCSHYAAEALRTHGLLRGLVLAIWRLLRCTPLGAGGNDPVPLPRARSLLHIGGRPLPHCKRIA